MAKYLIRFFFDAGSGICFWAGNDAALERFDYSIETKDLGLNENIWRRIGYLNSWYDTSLDWNYPSNPSPWDNTELQRFNHEAQKLLVLVRDQLGPDYEIIDESGTADSRVAYDDD